MRPHEEVMKKLDRILELLDPPKAKVVVKPTRPAKKAKKQ